MIYLHDFSNIFKYLNRKYFEKRRSPIGHSMDLELKIYMETFLKISYSTDKRHIQYYLSSLYLTNIININIKHKLHNKLINSAYLAQIWL